MPRNVRGALLQATWTGDKESMIQKYEGRAHGAARQRGHGKFVRRSPADYARLA